MKFRNNQKISMMYLLLLIFVMILRIRSLSASVGAISYESFQRLNDPINVSAKSWFGVELDTSHKSRYFDTHLDLSGRFYHSKSDYILSLSEGYVLANNRNSFKDQKFIFGRKVVNWSSAEEFFRLEYINSNRGMKLLDNKRDGLVGIHYNYKINNRINLDVVLSYLFVPQLNPGMTEVDGNIESNQDWAKLPPTRTELEGETLPIRYTIDMPYIPEVIVNKTLGTRLEGDYGQLGFSVFGLYKPENRLRINAEAGLEQPNAQEAYISVTAKPIVNYHTVLGLEGRVGDNLTKKRTGRNLQIGFLQSDPNGEIGEDFSKIDPVDSSPVERTNYTEYLGVDPNYYRESYMNGQLNFKRKFFNLSLNYLHMLDGHKRKSDDFFSDKPKWNRTAGLNLNYDVSAKLDFSFDIKYDLEMKDNILNTYLGFMLSRDMRWGLGAELIRSPHKESYWALYRANDIIYSNFSYLF